MNNTVGRDLIKNFYYSLSCWKFWLLVLSFILLAIPFSLLGNIPVYGRHGGTVGTLAPVCWFLWFVLVYFFALNTFEQTLVGNNESLNFSDFNIHDILLGFWHFLFMVLLSTIPGVFFLFLSGGSFGFYSDYLVTIPITISITLVFPVIFLSSLFGDSHWEFFVPAVIRNIPASWNLWNCFYLHSFILSIVIMFLGINFFYRAHEYFFKFDLEREIDLSYTFLPRWGLMVGFSICSIIYMRLFGCTARLFEENNQE